MGVVSFSDDDVRGSKHILIGHLVGFKNPVGSLLLYPTLLCALTSKTAEGRISTKQDSNISILQK